MMARGGTQKMLSPEQTRNATGSSCSIVAISSRGSGSCKGCGDAGSRLPAGKPYTERAETMSYHCAKKQSRSWVSVRHGAMTMEDKEHGAYGVDTRRRMSSCDWWGRSGGRRHKGRQADATAPLVRDVHNELSQ